MNLKEYLERLSWGELSNVYIGNGGVGSIPLDKIDRVVYFINEGLKRLYTRFALKKSCLFLELNEYRTQYHLSNLHAYEGPNADNEDCELYIRDTPENPYENDLIKIMDVYDSMGNHLPLNDHANSKSVFTPQYNILQVPFPDEGLALSIVYQASHPLLDWNKNPEQEVELPEVLMGALTAYVAYLHYSNMNTQEAVANAQKYLTQYNSILNEVVETDVVNTSYSQTNVKFNERGFV